MYNKIFTKILDSSIWLETTPTRIVWLMFIAVMDESGFAQFASVKNVAHRARVTNDEAQTAIVALEGPDADSSDPAQDGRRIERVPGGWMVLNAEKYRALVTRAVIQDQTRSRVQAFRDKEKQLGFIYYAKTNGNIKIGWSSNPGARMMEFKTLDPNVELIAVEKGTKKQEKETHKKFKNDNIAGELFRSSEAISEHIDGVLKRIGNASVTPSDTDTDTRVPTPIEVFDPDVQKRKDAKKNKGKHRGHVYCGDHFCVEYEKHERFERRMVAAGIDKADVDLKAMYATWDRAFGEAGTTDHPALWLEKQFAAALKAEHGEV